MNKKFVYQVGNNSKFILSRILHARYEISYLFALINVHWRERKPDGGLFFIFVPTA